MQEHKTIFQSFSLKIRMIDHQRQSLEETLNSERARSADQLHSMERRFREVQEVLFVKMQEANISRDTNIPLKAEIEALKALLQEEERRYLYKYLNFSVKSYQCLIVKNGLPEIF